MGNQNTSALSMDVEKLLRKRIPKDQPIVVEPKLLEVRPSTNSNAGEGVFALELIPKDTIFLVCPNAAVASNEGIDRKINDLAYQGTTEGYETDEHILENTNVGYVLHGGNFFEQPGVYLYAMRDIQVGEELSRHYGLPYWQENEFWRKFPTCRFLETDDIQDLPSEYVFVNVIRPGLTFNRNYSLFAKKEGDKYFYLAGYEREYYIPGFFEKNKFFDLTKPDFSPYGWDEAYKVENGFYYTDDYLKATEQPPPIPKGAMSLEEFRQKIGKEQEK